MARATATTQLRASWPQMDLEPKWPQGQASEDGMDVSELCLPTISALDRCWPIKRLRFKSEIGNLGAKAKNSGKTIDR